MRARRYRSRPAVGHAQAAVLQAGFHHVAYVGPGTTDQGPVQLFLGTRDGGSWEVAVGRVQGDQLEVKVRGAKAQVRVRARQNSEDPRRAAAEEAIKRRFAAKAAAKAIPYVGQAAAVVEGAPVAWDETKKAYRGSQAAGESFKRAAKEKGLKGKARGAKAAVKELWDVQSGFAKGTIKTGMAALVGQEMAKANRRRQKGQSRRNPCDPALAQDVLAHLRALQWVYWSAHWSSAGPNFYGDHLLLERLYAGKDGGPDITKQIDGLGERMVAYHGAKVVSPAEIEDRVREKVRWAADHGQGQGALEALYGLEGGFQSAVRAAWKSNQDSAEPSLGLDNFYMQLADERDTARYLIGQRLGVSPPDRSPVEEGLPADSTALALTNPLFLAGTSHFQQRMAERAQNLSARKERKLEELYQALKSGRARLTGRHGRYAVQFGGEPGGQGDYLVVQVENGVATGWITVLVDQRVIDQNTTVLLWGDVMGTKVKRNRRNPRRAARLVNFELIAEQVHKGQAIASYWTNKLGQLVAVVSYPGRPDQVFYGKDAESLAKEHRDWKPKWSRRTPTGKAQGNPQERYRGSAREGWYTDLSGQWVGPPSFPEGRAFTVMWESRTGKEVDPKTGKTIYGTPSARVEHFDRYGQRDKVVFEQTVKPFVRSLLFRQPGLVVMVFDSANREIDPETGARKNPRRAKRNSTKGAYPFADKEAQYTAYTVDQLIWALNDAKEARDNMRGHDLKAEAWYADDVHTILSELRKRGVKNLVRR